jgi:hypothetical protein
MRHTIHAVRGTVAYGFRNSGQSFTPVPIEQMQPGQDYEYALLPAGEEVSFHFVRLSQNESALMVACATEAGAAIAATYNVI